MTAAITLIIDRVFKGVGRLKKATGTTNPTVRRKMSRMLTVLYDEGRLDLLRGLRDGRFSLPELHDAYQRKALDRLPTAEAVRPLATAMRAWVEAATDYSAKHREAIQTSIRYVETKHGKATMHDAPFVLADLRKTLSDRPRSFNLLRSHVSSFVRQELGRAHALYLGVQAVEPRKVKKATKRSPLSVQQMQGFFPNRATDALDGMAWSMATTGMRLNEYFGRWSTQPDRVRVYGTKTAAAVRDVPLVLAPVVPSMHRRTFEDKLRERTGRAIQPYDLRRTYMNWMEAAGVPRTRRKLYLGHAAGDVSDLYERHEVDQYLAEDATKLRAHLGVEEPPTMKLVKGA